MNKHWAKTTVLVLLWATIAVAGFGSAVWQLWNMLMPHLFGMPSIGFWQAVGLMALSNPGPSVEAPKFRPMAFVLTVTVTA